MSAPGGPVAEWGMNTAYRQDFIDFFQLGFRGERGRVHDQLHTKESCVPPDARNELQGEVEKTACRKQNTGTYMVRRWSIHVRNYKGS
ncbi:hypothetical protein PSDVSF_21280 [Pseudodesulfovibrio sediminis]|uniref:Uncharacterized protein n=1 Tax=Pseudodesulfovibrio sediminis TaxID=2810563 RepID=A0ABM7P7F6_9BACT|nr:hypothetical protein PSDVSF_21280 [Pseudodesulfovibrio sediminis]